jgi:hypothetical protein
MAGIESVQYKPEEDIPVIYQAAVEIPTQHHLSAVLILVVSYCVLAGIYSAYTRRGCTSD